MVDQVDLAQVAILNSESQSLRRALAYLTGDGRIVQMMIAPPDIGSEMMQMPVTVITSQMQYPQAMVEAIKGELEKRRSNINQELGELGVTGLDAEPSEPLAARPMPPRPRR